MAGLTSSRWPSGDEAPTVARDGPDPGREGCAIVPLDRHRHPAVGRRQGGRSRDRPRPTRALAAASSRRSGRSWSPTTRAASAAAVSSTSSSAGPSATSRNPHPTIGASRGRPAQGRTAGDESEVHARRAHPVARSVAGVAAGAQRRGEEPPRNAVMAARTTRATQALAGEGRELDGAQRGRFAVRAADVDRVEPEHEVVGGAGHVVADPGLGAAPASRAATVSGPACPAGAIRPGPWRSCGPAPVDRRLDQVREGQEGHAAPADDALVDLETAAQRRLDDRAVESRGRGRSRSGSPTGTTQPDRRARGPAVVGVAPGVAEVEEDEPRREPRRRGRCGPLARRAASGPRGRRREARTAGPARRAGRAGSGGAPAAYRGWSLERRLLVVDRADCPTGSAVTPAA